MYSAHKESGWPLWPLFATIPVVLALGFVVGMASATYLPTTGATPAPATTAASTSLPAPGGATGPQGDSSWVIPTSPNSAPGVVPAPAANGAQTPAGPPAVNPPPIVNPAPPFNPSPVSVYFRGKASTIGEAQAALRTDYGLFRLGNETIYFDYETMRQASGGVALIGMISVRDYAVWAQALQTEPDTLKSWLERAAERVLPASTAEGFHLGWAVVDVVRSRPDGFSASEITVLDNRSFLIIRPLAATEDHTKSRVSLRLPAEMSKPATPGHSPWATYGPIINFDSTDLYRPTRALNAQPLDR